MEAKPEMAGAGLLLKTAMDGAFDVLLLPFSGLPSAAGLSWISAIAGVLLAWIFRATSDQERIGRERRLMGGIAAGLLLHVQDPRAVMGIGARLLAANARYLLAMAPALLLASVPFGIFLGQVQGRFGFEAPSAGDTVLVLFTGRQPFAGSDAVSSGAATAIPPFFRSGDGRTYACRLAFTGGGPAGIALDGATLVVGRSGPTSPAGRELASGLSLEALLRPDVEVSGASGISGEAVLRPKRYQAFSIGLSELAVFLLISTASAILTGAALKVSI